jgi:hypothetical protein
MHILPRLDPTDPATDALLGPTRWHHLCLARGVRLLVGASVRALMQRPRSHR